MIVVEVSRCGRCLWKATRFLPCSCSSAHFEDDRAPQIPVPFSGAHHVVLTANDARATSRAHIAAGSESAMGDGGDVGLCDTTQGGGYEGAVESPHRYTRTMHLHRDAEQDGT